MQPDMALMLALCAAPCHPPPNVTIPLTEVHGIDSGPVGRELRLWVAHPVDPAMPRPKAPSRLLVVLDAELFFGMACDTARLMHQLYGELPPILVLGIAYPGEDRSVQAQLRSRDFTPSTDPEFENMTRGFGGEAFILPAGERTGGARAFAEFLEFEALPFVRDRFDIAEDGTTLFGSSLGGLFANWLMLERPDLFDNYIIASPALWWQEGELFDLEDAYAETRDDLEARVYFAVGGDEENPAVPGLARYRMISNTKKMAERLRSRGFPSLDLLHRTFEGETHTTVVPAALTHGLRHAYRRSR